MAEKTAGIFQTFRNDYERFNSQEELTLQEYLDLCKIDPTAYASPAERMLQAIGEPVILDSKQDPRLSKIFSNKIIRTYPNFKEFYGMEETIDQLVSFFRHAAQGLEESKQILYLLGPVGGGKSTLAEKMKELFENVPVWVLKDSPVFESPLGLFPRRKYAKQLHEDYNIPPGALRSVMSPWAVQKMIDFNGDISLFNVVKIHPSRIRQVCITRVEPGDENNQDISSMVGKVDIRKLEEYAQDHPYAYSYSGGLNRGNNGMVEMVEMFKAPIKMLNPLLTATQDRQYKGTEAISAMPFDGIIIAHSNESEWQQFRNNKTNEAFLDRVNLIQIPYCLRVNEEVEIYKKLIRDSDLFSKPCAPGTLEFLAQECILSRIVEPENSTAYSKMRVYNGENIKDVDPKAKPLQEYKDEAGVKEGMEGLSVRFAFKTLSKTFNYDAEEIGANPIHLMIVLENEIIKEQFAKEKENILLTNLKGILQDKYFEQLEKDIRASFLESFSDLCQNVFENYIYYADAWVQDSEYRDPNTGVLMSREDLNLELEKIEKAAEITNAKDWRNEITQFVLRYAKNHGGQMPRWNSYEKMRIVVEKKVLATTDEILPVISFAPKKSKDEIEKHQQFVAKMMERGYTERQTRLLCEYFMRHRKSS